MPTDTPPSTWLPPETPRHRSILDGAGLVRYLRDRAAIHRVREESSTTTDAANKAADQAEECEAIVFDLARYWGVE